ncbi:major facilitator superfamily domain-containing protein 10-like isoform X2 [Microtus oregoni]|uniref:major facilitator superfamily domain-containing protein 10-like isoform X2 n=1 Tax=Microtus oregoni TaxID=111838 RepID=UPI001BB24156|nr:major facilitator superfamily domain-containing protein 10-like isoform X2 [Microtus oregoni]
MGWEGDADCTPRPPIRPCPVSERRVVTVIFLGLLLDLLAFTLLLPLLPGLLESHGREQDPLYGSWQRGVDWFATAIGMPAEKRYNSVLFGGLIGSAFSLLQFFSAPLTGAASDCLGRRPVMLLSLTGLAISYAVWAASRSFSAFLASRVIGGISKGNVSLSTAIVADLSSPPSRSQGMAPSVTLGFHAAANLLSPLALLRFAAVTHSRDPPAEDRLKSLRRLGLVYFLYLFLFSGLEYTLSFLVHQRFQFSSLQQGKMFFFIGLTMATIQGTYARRISPGKEVATVKRAMLLLVPAFLLIGWAHSLPMLGLGLLLYSFAAAVVVPGLSTMVSSYGSPGQKGTIMGILRSLGALGRAVGPMVAASVYWLAGAQVCFTVCSGLFLLPFFLLWTLRHPAPTFKEE